MHNEDMSYCDDLRKIALYNLFWLSGFWFDCVTSIPFSFIDLNSHEVGKVIDGQTISRSPLIDHADKKRVHEHYFAHYRSCVHSSPNCLACAVRNAQMRHHHAYRTLFRVPRSPSCFNSIPAPHLVVHRHAPL